MIKSYFVFILSALVLVSGGCKKKEEIIQAKAYEPSTLNQFFETYILNKDIRITQAKFEGRDTTSMHTD